MLVQVENLHPLRTEWPQVFNLRIEGRLRCLCRLKTCTHFGQTCTHFGEPWPQAHFFRGSGPVISKFSVIEPAVTVIFSCDARPHAAGKRSSAT